MMEAQEGHGPLGSGPRRAAATQDPVDDEEDDSFQVRDLLIWSAEDSRTRMPQEARPGEGRLAYKGFAFEAIGLFYTCCVFTLLAVAELVMKPHLEKVGIALIKQMQTHDRDAASHIYFFDRVVGFSPDVWAFMPAIALASFPAWRPVAARILLLQGVGLVIQWAFNIIFRQGRPFWVDKKVEIWHCPTTYGFPSGHAFILLLVVAPLVDELWTWHRQARLRHRHHALSLRARACRRATLWPVLGSTVLVAAYTTCLVGRMYLGTHFLHSVLMGTVCGALLLQVLTKKNVAILIDRIALTVELDGASSLSTRVIEAFGRAAGIALVMLAACHLLLLFCEHLATDDPDPARWAARAKKECGDELRTMRGSEVKAHNGIAIIVGWFLAVSLTALRPGGIVALIGNPDASGRDSAYGMAEASSPRRRSLRKNSQGSVAAFGVAQDPKAAAPRAGNYGSISPPLSPNKESSSRAHRSQSVESSALSSITEPPEEFELCNVGMLLAVASFISKMAVGYMLAFLMRMPSCGRVLAVLFALFVFPQVLFVTRPSCYE